MESKFQKLRKGENSSDSPLPHPPLPALTHTSTQTTSALQLCVQMAKPADAITAWITVQSSQATDSPSQANFLSTFLSPSLSLLHYSLIPSFFQHSSSRSTQAPRYRACPGGQSTYIIIFHTSDILAATKTTICATLCPPPPPYLPSPIFKSKWTLD